MRYKQIVVSVFVIFIFNLFALNPFSRPNRAPNPGPALYGQDVDLVKLKKEEEERKKKTKKSKYVITNDNLDKIEVPKKPYGVIKLGGKGAEEAAATAGGDMGSQGDTGVADNSSSGSQADAVGAVDRQSKTYWQDRVNKLYDDIEATDTDIKSSQQELDQLYGALQAEDLYNKRLEYEKRMSDLEKHIPEAQQKLADLYKSLEDLEDQARKENIPAGWLRVERPEPNTKKEVGQIDRKQKG
ncbi:MAG: hypothetical protein NT166_30635 [Candidatus Aminicenantes bacterium]|nr:hypothetical protein [Candidatus Aminicenantes bacterium]